MSGKYLQGKYEVKNPQKYLGDRRNIIYRSSWELKMFIWCDTNDKVIKWNSEEIVVPYVSPFDGKYHRYYTDVYVEMIENNKRVKRVCEIKPAKELLPPKKPKRRTKAYIKRLETYLINKAKWTAADKYCKERNMQFKILTEKELGIR